MAKIKLGMYFLDFKIRLEVEVQINWSLIFHRWQHLDINQDEMC